MFEKLLSQIKEPALEIIQQQSMIPMDRMEIAANDAIASISEEIDRIMDSGDFSSLSNMRDPDHIGENTTIQNIIASYSQKLQSNNGLDVLSANTTSESIVPTLFVTMKKKFSAEKLDLKTLMGNLSLSEIMKLMANMGKLKEAFGK